MTALEYQEQETVFEYCYGYGGNINPNLRNLHAVENTKGAGRPPAGAEESAGVPDMFLAVAVAPFHGLYIELKRMKGGKVSPKQYAWHRKLRANGYAVEVCKGAESAIATLELYLAGGYPSF